MNITRVHPADLNADWVDRLNQYSVLSSLGLLRLWESVGGRPVVWIAEEGGEIVAALPAVEFGSKPMVRLQAMPDGLYAHLVWRDNSRPDERIRNALMSEMGKAGYARIFVTDYFGELINTSQYDSTELATTVVDISSPTWEPPDAKLRSEVRKAEREGVIVHPFERTKHMTVFLQLMQQTEARHGRKPKYPDIFFAQLADLAEKDDRIVWWYVEHEGQPVASHIYFLDQHTALNWQIYFDKQFSSFKANQLMLFRAAGAFSQRGIRFLNLGATPEDAEGVKTYKDKWGGVTNKYLCYTRHSLLGRLA